MTDHALMRRAAAVWRALALGFPTFQTVYGDDPAPIWVAAIATLTDEQCRAGVTELAKRADNNFPPNLLEFETAARAGSRPPEQRRYEPPPVPRNSAIRDRTLASIKAKLGMPT